MALTTPTATASPGGSLIEGREAYAGFLAGLQLVDVGRVDAGLEACSRVLFFDGYAGYVFRSVIHVSPSTIFEGLESMAIDGGAG